MDMIEYIQIKGNFFREGERRVRMKRQMKGLLAALLLAFTFILTVPAGAGTGTVAQAENTSYEAMATVRVESGYLALRNYPAYDYSNETGKLYNGDTVYVISTPYSDYWWVYSPSLNREGYVNCNYLVNVTNFTYSSPSYIQYTSTATVKVQSGYLALRTARAFDYSNEIGRLYTGDTVYIMDTTYNDYWWVYAPTAGRQGYVNKDYLVNIQGVTPVTDSYATVATVVVETSYLALRNAPAYDYYNEIGKLYTGDIVYILEETYPDYWWVYSPALNKSGYVNKNFLYW